MQRQGQISVVDEFPPPGIRLRIVASAAFATARISDEYLARKAVRCAAEIGVIFS
jgi:hypothetical protein